MTQPSSCRIAIEEIVDEVLTDGLPRPWPGDRSWGGW